jgi:hypothetical protein
LICSSAKACIVDGSKQSRKEFCWQYYKSQMLYIEAMQEAKNDSEYDPRIRNDHITGKDGRFTKKRNATTKPKNPLTVQYLCYAFEIPYATFKRWKKDAFVTKKYVPETKGNSVLTDKKLASQVFNPRKIYVTNTMAVWLNKHPAKKNDGSAKKLQRESFKLRWFNLTEEERIPYEKQARDYLAKQELMKECINTDALRKQQGGNCSRSYASLAKVCT